MKNFKHNFIFLTIALSCGAGKAQQTTTKQMLRDAKASVLSRTKFLGRSMTSTNPIDDLKLKYTNNEFNQQKHYDLGLEFKLLGPSELYWRSKLADSLVAQNLRVKENLVARALLETYQNILRVYRYENTKPLVEKLKTIREKLFHLTNRANASSSFEETVKILGRLDRLDQIINGFDKLELELRSEFDEFRQLPQVGEIPDQLFNELVTEAECARAQSSAILENGNLLQAEHEFINAQENKIIDAIELTQEVRNNDNINGFKVSFRLPWFVSKSYSSESKLLELNLKRIENVSQVELVEKMCKLKSFEFMQRTERLKSAAQRVTFYDKVIEKKMPLAVDAVLSFELYLTALERKIEYLIEKETLFSQYLAWLDSISLLAKFNDLNLLSKNRESIGL